MENIGVGCVERAVGVRVSRAVGGADPCTSHYLASRKRVLNNHARPFVAHPVRPKHMLINIRRIV